MKRVLVCIEGPAASAYSNQSRGVVGGAKAQFSSGDASELVGGEVALRTESYRGVDEVG